MQMTRQRATYGSLGSSGTFDPVAMDLRYVFTTPSSPINDGRIIQRDNIVSGETVTYTYDALQRLEKAETASAAWGLSWDYDGFGNRWEQRITKGTAPPSNVSFDLATNRVNAPGYAHDANGNMTAMPGYNNLTYDIDNRLLSAYGNGSWEQYAYLADNKRVWKQSGSNWNPDEQYYLYGVGGERIVTYTVNKQMLNEGILSLTANSYDVYFGGRLIWQNGKAVLRDRLGSVMARVDYYTGIERHDYFPYGEERTPSIGDRNKFGTYHRDQTGLDYADQRYYNSAIGRFLSADPTLDSVSLMRPDSWNRHSYIEADPINFNDPRGLCKESMTPTSVTICGEMVFVPYEIYILVRGENGWNWNATFQQYNGMQSVYESGACTTWYGIPCYEEARQKGELLATTQTILDLAGLIPVYGEVADIANAMLYAAQGDILNAGVSAFALFPVGGQAFTGARLFRQQVIDRLGVSATDAVGKHAHHMLPQQANLHSFFAKAGINIQSPEWGTLWDAKDHLKHAYQYNLRWQEFFLRNPTAGVQQIKEFAAQQAQYFGLDWKP
jgi:RHS repeat-associated protein